MHHGAVSEALQETNAVLDADPSHRAARMQAGYLYRLLGDRAKAIAAYQAVADDDPHLVQALMELAREVMGARPRSKKKLAAPSVPMKSGYIYRHVALILYDYLPLGAINPRFDPRILLALAGKTL
jgi:predicted Zn-dependent protease